MFQRRPQFSRTTVCDYRFDINHPGDVAVYTRVRFNVHRIHKEHRPGLLRSWVAWILLNV